MTKMTPVHPQFLEQTSEETARLRRALEGVKDWAARSGANGLEQWCSEALSPTGKLDVVPSTTSSTGRRLCFCACCCQTPTGYRSDEERAECTCKVRAPDTDPRDTTIKALADALRMQGSTRRESSREWHSEDCIRCFVPSKPECTPDCVAARAAFRLAGR